MFMPRSPGFSSMLKDGAKHIEGVDDVVYRNIEACVELSKLTSSSYGPCGLTKFVINHLGKLYTTSDAAVVMGELDVQHPAAKLLSMACEQQDREVGDGTNYVILLGAALLSRASTNLLRMGLTPCQIQRGYEIGMCKCEQILEAIANKFRVNNMGDVDEIGGYLRSVIASKCLGCEDFLAPLVADACIKTTKNSVDGETFNVDNIRVCKIRGGSVYSSFLVQGLVLKSDVEGQCRSITDCKPGDHCVDGSESVKIAVFSCPFDISTLETKGTVLLHNAAELMSFTKDEETSFRNQIEAIHNAGVQVVVSGSKFSDLGVHYLDQFNIIAIRVTSKFELRRIAKSCGAFVQPKLKVPEPHELGLCRNVFCEEIGQTQVVRFDSLDSTIMTLVVRASTDQVLDDIERAVNDAVNVYKAFTKDTRLVPGGCATDIQLAHQLRSFATAVDGDKPTNTNVSLPADSLERYAIQAFGEAFELPVRMFIDNCGISGTEMLAKLYSMHVSEGDTPESMKYYGITMPGGKLRDVCMPEETEPQIMDSYLVKLSGIRLAVQAINSILSVDQIIMAKPAGGPKPKENSNWDQD